MPGKDRPAGPENESVAPDMFSIARSRRLRPLPPAPSRVEGHLEPLTASYTGGGSVLFSQFCGIFRAGRDVVTCSVCKPRKEPSLTWCFNCEGRMSRGWSGFMGCPSQVSLEPGARIPAVRRALGRQRPSSSCRLVSSEPAETPGASRSAECCRIPPLPAR
jgi:hypothetical protein